jgi:hypothetical protein
MSHRELLPIPPIETATDPAFSAADLQQRWRALMGPLGFGERLLRFAFMGPDRCLIKILGDVEIGPAPERPVIENLMSALREILCDMEPNTTVALLLTRPGPGGISSLDRQWSTMLTEAATEYGVPIEPVFRANDDSLVQVEPELERAPR